MARTIVIDAGISLTYTPDDSDASRTVILSKWICDKHYDKILVKSAYAEPIVIEKISASNPITVNTIAITDPTEAQTAIGSNW